MKVYFFNKQILSLYFILISFSAMCQQSFVDANVVSNFNDALKLYNNKAYAAAQKSFEKIKVNANNSSNLKADASFYDAICAVKLNQTNADKKVLTFVEDNPTSTKKNKAYFIVGNYYFANKKAAHALKWYQKVDTETLSKENKKELNFKMGYGLLVSKNLSLAKERFLPLINDAKYGNDSRYYYGFIAYKLEDYGVAESTLKEIADNKSYKAEISYYLLDISFKAGNFERCVIVGQKLLETSRRKDISEISKIIGESYFNLKKYEEAIPYLKAYKGKRGKWNNTDYYQLGYALYKQNDFEQAINYFNKIISQKNAVAQNAYYHLAECYLNVDKKIEALNAFKAASEMAFNTKIKKDAALNYAKLSYEQGNPFENVSDVLQNYLTTYPNSPSYNEINKLVVSSFIHQKDYKGALEYLKKKKSSENILLNQEVSYYRAIQLFNTNKYQEAIPYFNNATNSNILELKTNANYWKAESLFKLDKFTEALSIFKNLKSTTREASEELKLIDYNIAYCFFKLKDYNNAANTFKKFTKKYTKDSPELDDAYLRLGDSYFASTNYNDAIKAYSIVVDNKSNRADYAQYQIGMCQGFKDNDDAKIISLTKVINEYQISNLKDDALYQLATTYTKLKNNGKAHQAYDRLISKYPKSTFLSRAIVRQGLLYYNDGFNNKALEKFKLIASKFPNSSDALEAVKNAKNIYIDEDNLDDYVTWTKTLKFINVSDSELENSSFAIAERKYFDGKNNGSILSLKKYLKNFPNGKNQLKARFYLAEVLFKEQLFDDALIQYNLVLNAGESDFRENTLSKAAQIYLQKEDFTSALPLLENLEQVAYNAENILFAQSNLMKGYYETEAYDSALNFAKKLLNNNTLSEKVKNDAKVIIARASIKTEDFDTAKLFYENLEEEANGEFKAETLYYNAFFKNRNKAYLESNKIIQKVIADYSAYKYWGVKSYVIMAKNYDQLNDAYQATFILENVIKNFTQFEDIVKEAKTELQKIKEKEAKTNNSVTPKNK